MSSKNFMEKKNSILIFGIISIMILILVQIFITKDIWRDKNEKFDLKYKLLSQEAMEQLYRMSRTDGFEDALELINNYSKEVMNQEYKTIKDSSELKKLKDNAFNAVIKILTELENLTPYLKNYFRTQGFESDFSNDIVINYLQFLDFDNRLEIYANPDLFTARPISDVELRSSTKTRILVNRFFREDNYYRIIFDYYIDFSGKQKMVLREMSIYLSMSIFSILVVMVIFVITYHNLMEEKRLSNLKTDFINNMTHEIKTPLSTITVAGKTLEMEQIRKDENKILETARLIGKQSVHLNQLINLILEISMWERTQFQLDKKEVEIQEFIHDIVNSFRTGNNDNATIIENYQLNGIKTKVDVVYFTTMINNLLSNAVKYSNKDPVIKVEGKLIKDNIVISIEDNGIGISKQDQKHIFDKFYRVSQGNIHKTKGLGLGLYYVKRIAEAHGGTVTVTSKLGQGSCFTIIIPK
ncbi:MAG TPA: HAMP domain-containing sensor histidine kinase [Bacteroidales bacterium]|nr:HAMP domain-containing sensor histidine kinase [Bacteroidales bacterium]HQG36168.1 HAMP domain-containing sensor histidine kinase [Bacteroidales bacterium]HQG53382.1 HAMP domain-containing sensor histidine kinase [Bacteroidales bacterium]HQJ20294.1 HAMP domain-containing sensor histidine kinase [Bacteroidales bacterium]